MYTYACYGRYSLQVWKRNDSLLIASGILQDKRKYSVCVLKCRYCVFTLWGRKSPFISILFFEEVNSFRSSHYRPTQGSYRGKLFVSGCPQIGEIDFQTYFYFGIRLFLPIAQIIKRRALFFNCIMTNILQKKTKIIYKTISVYCS